MKEKRQVVNCQRCGSGIQPKNKGPLPKWCAACKVVVNLEQERERNGVRTSYVCQDCGASKERSKMDGPLPKRCPKCAKERVRKRSTSWQEENRERANQNAKKHRQKPDYPTYNKERKKMDRSDPMKNKRIKRTKLRSKYGLTDDQIDELFESASGRCPVCLEVFLDSGKKKACVDHDHATGEVRGLLCSACNTALGFLDDDQKRITRLASYLNPANRDFKSQG